MYFCYIVTIVPQKRMWHFVWINLNFQGCFFAKFGRNWPSGSWEEDENVKCLQADWQTDRQTTRGQQAIRKAHLSFQLRWAKTKNTNCRNDWHLYQQQNSSRSSQAKSPHVNFMKQISREIHAKFTWNEFLVKFTRADFACVKKTSYALKVDLSLSNKANNG